MKQTPTHSRVLELLFLNPETGKLCWAQTLGSRAKAGEIAGSLTRQGYRVIRIDGELWRSHHLAWLMHTGHWPDGIVMHKNLDKDDNHPSNLVIGSKTQAHAHTRAERVDAYTVHDIFSYDNGQLRWKRSLGGKSRIAGAVAGAVNEDGYVIVETGGKATRAHRIIWLMHHGEWPRGEIDHFNGVRHDNRIENLRDVVRATNTENRRKAPRHSRTGLLGAELLSSGKFRARIRSEGKLHELGTFDSAEAAHLVYIEAKRLLHAGNTL